MHDMHMQKLRKLDDKKSVSNMSTTYSDSNILEPELIEAKRAKKQEMLVGLITKIWNENSSSKPQELKMPECTSTDALKLDYYLSSEAMKK